MNPEYKKETGKEDNVFDGRQMKGESRVEDKR